MEPFIIHLPVVDMREKPSRESKVVSQALFGEEIQEKERQGEWSHIATPDGYLGWVKKSSYVESSYSKDIEITRLRAHIYDRADIEYGPLMTLPFGSPLQVLDSTDPRWIHILLPDGKKAFIQKGDVEPDPKDFVSFCKQFLGLPYTWGGRSSFGYDCSGYTQMVFARQGILFKRDARQQVLDPRLKTIAIEDIALGDLIFWGKSERDVRHVGISLGGTTFIHSSSKENKPYLRISQWTDFEWSGKPQASLLFRVAKKLFS